MLLLYFWGVEVRGVDARSDAESEYVLAAGASSISVVWANSATWPFW